MVESHQAPLLNEELLMAAERGGIWGTSPLVHIQKHVYNNTEWTQQGIFLCTWGGTIKIKEQEAISLRGSWGDMGGKERYEILQQKKGF